MYKNHVPSWYEKFDNCARAIITTSDSGIGNCRCSVCNTYIDPLDIYCRHCGRSIDWTNWRSNDTREV